MSDVDKFVDLLFDDSISRKEILISQLEKVEIINKEYKIFERIKKKLNKEELMLFEKCILSYIRNP